MREDLLHFIWKHKKFQQYNLVTANNLDVSITSVGVHNYLTGPDFFNAQISIDNQLWAGNVEIHVKSSDWYAHNHETDANYDNVILHVVWEDDVPVYRKDKTQIPTLELKDYISPKLLGEYQKLFDNKKRKFINCENQIQQIDEFTVSNWMERLYFERLEQKSNLISELLKESNNDWEQVLFILLLKSFGSKINGSAFLSLGKSIDFSIIRKVQSNSTQFESLLYGASGLLNDNDILDSYYLELKNEYAFLRNKFNLKTDGVEQPHFFKLRPANFPTIRLSQLVQVYHLHQTLFQDLISAKNVSEIYSIFEITTSEYWNTHYNFGKESKNSIKKLTKSFVDLIIINTILPLKFYYSKHLGKQEEEVLIEIISKIKKENNSIVTNFDRIKVMTNNAKESQALIQLYNGYCEKNKCLDCAIGTNLLSKNN